MAYNYPGQRHNHICGCYILEQLGTLPSGKRLYLPQVCMYSHVIVRSHTFDTVLTQTFINPTPKSLKRIRYSFPLYDGVSVVDFTCETGSRTIKGVVKRRDIARATFDKAVERGETAGLLEQLPEASDVFTTTVGNIEPQTQVKITIKYIGELKHDAGVDGLRLTIPTAIAPRYGEYPGEIMDYGGSRGGMQITVDAEMTSAISKVQSPTHPISMSIGTVSTDPDAEPTLTRASATLSQSTTELDKDIVIQVIAKDIGVPRAILETHPSIPGHRAISATLVPNFALQPAKCEVIFVADRSGSMSGKIATLKSALRVALKSLPLGTHFNICSFGTSHSFLWRQSKLYSQETLDTAMAHIGGFAADYGGTEMFEALRAATEHRRKGSNTEILLLTDGEIYAQDEIISYFKTQVDGTLRLFTLGIGNQVSHSLIEGVARAGNGCSQSVGNEEQLDGKMMRLIKCALSTHVEDYSIELRSKSNATEKISTTVFVDAKDKQKPNGGSQKPIPLYSSGNKTNELATTPEAKEPDDENDNRYAHLPSVSYPPLLQAPRFIPPLFPLNRTTVYLLMSPNTAHLKPSSVILRGKSPQGPLELEIPIDTLEQPSTTVHQLAAKKAIQELEDGYGWFVDATDQNQKSIVASYPNLIDEIVEREAVRLGTTFQVSGKACSFVAVETDEAGKAKDAKDAEADMDYEWVDADTTSISDDHIDYCCMSYSNPKPSGFSLGLKKRMTSSRSSKQTLRNNLNVPASHEPKRPVFHAIRVGGPLPAPAQAAATPATILSSLSIQKCCSVGNVESDALAGEDPPTLLDLIVGSQTFQGSWPADALSWKELGLDQEKSLDVLRALRNLGEGAFTEKSAEKALATAVVVLYLERKMAEQKEIWELLAEKARAWLADSFNENDVELLFQGASNVVGEE